MKKNLLLFVFCIFITHLFSTTKADYTDQDYLDTIRAITKTGSIKAYTVDELRYAIITESDTIRYFILSTDYSQVKGYRGITTLGLILNSDLTVHHVEIISSQDTRSYITRINAMGLMQRLIGYKAGDQVELVTGATMTSDAIIKTIDESITRFKEIK